MPSAHFRLLQESTFSTLEFEIDCSEYKGNNLICTAEYDPLCGSDGRTYGNKCQFCNAVSNQAAIKYCHFPNFGVL
uniref:Ovomucoid n=1 Tax=Strix occidentalis caurina TaxID=311401 RepID=A0A8D0FXR1_STROC